VKSNGKPVAYGVETLSADGHSFIDATWSPGKQSEKDAEFYVKQ
jgi:hypothetical protein